MPEPRPGPDEDLCRVAYATVNPLDVWVTDGTVAGGSQRLPFVPGADGVGEIDGRLVLLRGFGLGVRRDGLYRELAGVPSAAPIALPGGVDPAQAAGLGVAGASAWAVVHEVGRVRPEDRVLVLGSSGGVGSLAVQLAKAAGAFVVGQTTSPEKARFVEGLGADGVVVAPADALAERAAAFEPTVALDPLGNGFTPAAAAALRPFGRIVLFGASAGPVAESFDLRALYRTSIQLLTYSGTIEPEDRVRASLGHAMEALTRGELRVPIDEVLPLEEANEAHRRIREREVRGKLLLQP